LPARIRPLREPGTCLGQSAEFFGTQHAHMLLRVIVHPSDEFDRWVVVVVGITSKVTTSARTATEPVPAARRVATSHARAS